MISPREKEEATFGKILCSILEVKERRSWKWRNRTVPPMEEEEDEKERKRKESGGSMWHGRIEIRSFIYWAAPGGPVSVVNYAILLDLLSLFLALPSTCLYSKNLETRDTDWSPSEPSSLILYPNWSTPGSAGTTDSTPASLTHSLLSLRMWSDAWCCTFFTSSSFLSLFLSSSLIILIIPCLLRPKEQHGTCIMYSFRTYGNSLAIRVTPLLLLMKQILFLGFARPLDPQSIGRQRCRSIETCSYFIYSLAGKV